MQACTDWSSISKLESTSFLIIAASEIVVPLELKKEAGSCIAGDMYDLSLLLIGRRGNENGPVGRSSTVRIDGKIDCTGRMRHRS